MKTYEASTLGWSSLCHLGVRQPARPAATRLRDVESVAERLGVGGGQRGGAHKGAGHGNRWKIEVSEPIFMDFGRGKVVKPHPWGTHLLVMDGMAYWTSAGPRPGEMEGPWGYEKEAGRPVVTTVSHRFSGETW